MRCLFVAVGLNACFIVLPRPHANSPSQIILTLGRPVMFRGPYFILSTMQAGTTHIFKVFGMTGPSTNQESNPQNHLVGAKSPYRRLLRSAGATEDLFVTKGLHQEPPPGFPWGKRRRHTVNHAIEVIYAKQCEIIIRKYYSGVWQLYKNQQFALILSRPPMQIWYIYVHSVFFLILIINIEGKNRFFVHFWHQTFIILVLVIPKLTLDMLVRQH